MINVNVLLFPEFETLTLLAGRVLGCVPEYQLHYVSVTGGTIISKQGIHVLTETLKRLISQVFC